MVLLSTWVVLLSAGVARFTAFLILILVEIFYLSLASGLITTITRGVVASAPDFERADEGSILTAGLCFKSGKSECNNSGYKLTGLTWWP